MIFNLLQAGDTELLETGVQAVAQEKTMSLIDMAVAGGWLMIVLFILPSSPSTSSATNGG